MLTETWFYMFWWVYLSSKSFFNVIVRFSWNWVCSILYQRWRSDLSSVFSISLKRSVYYMTAASCKYKERFNLMIFSSLIAAIFLIHWIKTKTFWIQSLLLIMIISFLIFNSESKSLISSDLNYLLNSLLTLMTSRAAMIRILMRFAVLMIAIITVIIFSIIWCFCSSVIRSKFSWSASSLILLIIKKLDELTQINNRKWDLCQLR